MSSSGCLTGPRPRSPHPNAAGQIVWHVVEQGWGTQDPGGAVDRGLKRAFGGLFRHPSALGPTDLSMMYHRDTWKLSGQPPSSPLGRCLYGTEVRKTRGKKGARQ
jgi:hypothetical protein